MKGGGWRRSGQEVVAVGASGDPAEKQEGALCVGGGGGLLEVVVDALSWHAEQAGKIGLCAALVQMRYGVPDELIPEGSLLAGPHGAALLFGSTDRFACADGDECGLVRRLEKGEGERAMQFELWGKRCAHEVRSGYRCFSCVFVVFRGEHDLGGDD